MFYKNRKNNSKVVLLTRTQESTVVTAIDERGNFYFTGRRVTIPTADFKRDYAIE